MTGILGTLIDAPSSVITFGRALFAVLALTPLLLFESKPRDQVTTFGSKDTAWRYLLSGLLLSVHWVTFFVSVKASGVAIATLGFSSFAAFISIIEWVIDRRSVERTDWLRTIVVSVGLAMITPSFNLGNQTTYGFIMGLLSGLSFAGMAVVNSHLLRGLNPIRVARNQNIVVALLLVSWALPDLHHLSTVSWLWLAILGIFCTGLSHSLFVSSLKRMRVNMAGLVIALEPVYAILAAWLLFAETPAWRTLLGGVIIVTAIVGVSYSKAIHESK